jgi:hypothetical protein
MDIVVWLRSLGLGKYEAVFRENEINGFRVGDRQALQCITTMKSVSLPVS